MKHNRGYDEVMIVNPYDPQSTNQQTNLMTSSNYLPKWATTASIRIWLLWRACRIRVLRRAAGRRCGEHPDRLLWRACRIRILRRTAGGYYGEHPDIGYYGEPAAYGYYAEPQDGYYGEHPI